MKPIFTPLNYTYKKEDSDVWVLNFTDIPVNAEKVKDKQMVHLAPQSTGGNHKHPRTEWFIGIGDLEFIWLDEQNKKHSKHMHPKGEIILITVPPFLPHAVRNNSDTQFGMLLEFADAKNEGTETIRIV